MQLYFREPENISSTRFPSLWGAPPFTRFIGDHLPPIIPQLGPYLPPFHGSTVRHPRYISRHVAWTASPTPGMLGAGCTLCTWYAAAPSWREAEGRRSGPTRLPTRLAW